MQELLTPVQYEPALDMLNQINKLTISQKASLSLDAMQACKNPVGHGNPIIGKFCKETIQGALCCNKVVREITDYEFIQCPLQTYPTWRSITFSQRVYAVLAWSASYDPPVDWNMWCTDNRQLILKFEYAVFTWLPFQGDTMWFSAKDDFNRGMVVVWGFY